MTGVDGSGDSVLVHRRQFSVHPSMAYASRDEPWVSSTRLLVSVGVNEPTARPGMVVLHSPPGEPVTSSVIVVSDSEQGDGVGTLNSARATTGAAEAAADGKAETPRLLAPVVGSSTTEPRAQAGPGTGRPGAKGT
jgi:hypothetical protein